MFAGKKSAQIREILISESAWEEMTCLFAPSLVFAITKIKIMVARTVEKLQFMYPLLWNVDTNVSSNIDTIDNDIFIIPELIFNLPAL